MLPTEVGSNTNERFRRKFRIRKLSSRRADRPTSKNARWNHKERILYKMILQEKRDLAIALAKEYYGDNYLSALWGSASVLLTEKDLDIIVKVMESNKWVP